MPPSNPSGVEMKNVYSSHVQRIGYDAKTQDLIVEWESPKGPSTKRSAYANVPPSLAHRIMNSASIGTALRTEIKPSFAHRYL